MLRSLMAGMACACAIAQAQAAPLVPSDDDQVIEMLPAAGGERAEERRLRREWVAHRGDADKAVALAKHALARARADGDPRRAGQALAALQAWPDPASAPDEVLLMRAVIEQHLHGFEATAQHLELLLRRQPGHAQAWLTLATVRRVQGRYAQSDAACEGLLRSGQTMHGQACRAENAGLRGETGHARDTLSRLIAAPRLAAADRNWLLTTLAELESRAARAAEAERAYRAALAAHDDAYTSLSYADFLLEQGRPSDALRQLKNETRSDAVLLRMAIASARSQAAGGAQLASELRERMRAAALRPEARATHAREQAMFALWIDKAPRRAWQLARDNLRRQREPLDLLVAAHAARALGDPAARQDVETIRKEMELHDLRLDSLR